MNRSRLNKSNSYLPSVMNDNEEIKDRVSEMSLSSMHRSESEVQNLGVNNRQPDYVFQEVMLTNESPPLLKSSDMVRMESDRDRMIYEDDGASFGIKTRSSGSLKSDALTFTESTRCIRDRIVEYVYNS